MGERVVIAEGLLPNVTERLSALAQTTRLLLIEQLADGGTSTPGELANELGLSQQTVSKHLKVLTQAGVVTRREQGGNAFYALKDPATITILDAVVASVVRHLKETSAHAAGLTRESPLGDDEAAADTA